MSEYLTKEEIRQWRSSLERITLEEYAARLGKKLEEEKETDGVAERLGLLLSVALATSIDALVVGAGFALAGLPVMELAIIAGVVTALACAVGVYLGRIAGARFGKKMELLGGALLILIGLEVLVSHLMDHGGMPF